MSKMTRNVSSVKESSDLFNNAVLNQNIYELTKQLKYHNALVDNENSKPSHINGALDRILSTGTGILISYKGAFLDTINEEGTKHPTSVYLKEMGATSDIISQCIDIAASLKSANDTESLIQQQIFKDNFIPIITETIHAVDNGLEQYTIYDESSNDENNYKNNFIYDTISYINQNKNTRPLYGDIVLQHALQNEELKNTSILSIPYYDLTNTLIDSYENGESTNGFEVLLNANTNKGVVSANEVDNLYRNVLSKKSSISGPILNDYVYYSSSFHNDKDVLEGRIYEMCKNTSQIIKNFDIVDSLEEISRISPTTFNTSSTLTELYGGNVTTSTDKQYLNLTNGIFSHYLSDRSANYNNKLSSTGKYLDSLGDRNYLKDGNLIQEEINFLSSGLVKSSDKKRGDVLSGMLVEYVNTNKNNNQKPDSNICGAILQSIKTIEEPTTTKLSYYLNVRGQLGDFKEIQENVDAHYLQTVKDANDYSIKTKINTLSNRLKELEPDNSQIRNYEDAISFLINQLENENEKFEALNDLSKNNEKFGDELEKFINDANIPADKIMELLENTQNLSERAKKILSEKISSMVDSGTIPIPQPNIDLKIQNEKGEISNYSLSTGNWYDKIINYPFEGSNIIDVISDYGWSNNQMWKTSKRTNQSFSKINNIPFCYVTEYKQLYNASISNILISLIGAYGAGKHILTNGGSAIKNILEMAGSLGKMALGKMGGVGSTAIEYGDKVTKAGGDLYNSFTSGASEIVSGFENEISKIGNKIINLGNGPISNSSDLLYPYRLMYILSPTNKKYCFPMLDKSASSFGVNNKMEEKDGGEGSKLLGNKLFSVLGEVTKSALGVAEDLANIAPFFNSSANAQQIKQYNIERSKYFSYPTEGETIEVSFILFNTVRKNIWKSHYRFIMGFVLRNLPFKQDMISYYPPLFYDVIVPGIKRCPYCYVEKIDVNPVGLMRVMKINGEDMGFGEKKSEYSVNVPEAWQIKISFKSLLGFSSNQILSGLIDTPIIGSVK